MFAGRGLEKKDRTREKRRRRGQNKQRRTRRKTDREGVGGGACDDASLCLRFSLSLSEQVSYPVPFRLLMIEKILSATSTRRTKEKKRRKKPTTRSSLSLPLCPWTCRTLLDAARGLLFEWRAYRPRGCTRPIPRKHETFCRLSVLRTHGQHGNSRAKERICRLLSLPPATKIS